MTRRLAVVLAHGPDSREAALALALALAGREAGVSVELFAMAEGVRVVEAPYWRELHDAATDVVLCGTSCERLGVNVPEGVLMGSQIEHATLVRRCDRLVALT